MLINNEEIKVVLSAAAFVLFVAWAGSSTEEHTVTSCRTIVTRSVEAVMLTDVLVPIAHADGTVTLDYDTVTTYKLASTKIGFITINGKSRQGAPYIYSKDGYYYGDYPPVTKDYTDHPDFYAYRNMQDVVISKYFQNGEHIVVNDHLQCLLDIGSVVKVRTMFGVKLWEM